MVDNVGLGHGQRIHVGMNLVLNHEGVNIVFATHAAIVEELQVQVPL